MANTRRKHGGGTKTEGAKLYKPKGSPNPAAGTGLPPAAAPAAAAAAAAAAGPAAGTAPAAAAPAADAVAPADANHIDLPYQVPDKYSILFNYCKSYFDNNITKFNNITNSTVNNSTVNNKDNAIQELIYKYKKLIKSTYDSFVDNQSQELNIKFFDLLESIREYHARALIVLYSVEDDQLSIPINYTKIYEFNDTLKIKPYEMPFIVIPLLYVMASWEWDTLRNEALKVFSKIMIAPNTGFPLHLEVLSEKYNNIEKYPQSLLMNYTMFYPFILHFDGKAPQNDNNDNIHEVSTEFTGSIPAPSHREGYNNISGESKTGE